MKLSGGTMPARTAIHIARWSSDHAMPSPRGDTGDEGKGGRSHAPLLCRGSEMARGQLPSLAVQHREVDVGHGRSGPPNRPGNLSKVMEDAIRTFERCKGWHAVGSGPPTRLGNLSKVSEETQRTFERCRGSGPPNGCNRAREWISRVRGDCWTMKRSRPRNKASTTRSCTSDAEHEFSRTRSPGLYPMQSFRDTRGPQLLLMRTTSARAGSVESDSESDPSGNTIYEAFS
jgi:hypothetical protein